MARYEGAIIDAHHHLWDLSLGRHPWLTSDAQGIKALGDISALRRDYLVPDFLADVGAEPVVGSVFVEAAWDRDRPADEEARWHAGLPRQGDIAGRYIGWAPLRAPALEASLDALARFPAFVGVRETVRWHPDPAKRWTEQGLIDLPEWRRGFAALGRRGLLFEVLMYPYQAQEIARLAADFPDQPIIVNHCSTPIDRDAEGLERWRAGLALMGARPNIVLKLSNFVSYAPDRTPAGLSSIVGPCLDAFGPERLLYASDYPVARRHVAYGPMCSMLKDALADLSAGEQRAIFHGNAARLYRFGR